MQTIFVNGFLGRTSKQCCTADDSFPSQLLSFRTRTARQCAIVQCIHGASANRTRVKPAKQNGTFARKRLQLQIGW